MRKNNSIILIVILLLAAVLRLWQFGSVPIAPDRDEVALGYTAYSLLQTGHDELGTFMPPALQSFGDYKPALYAYLTIPSVALFGLHTIAVRLPSMLMGMIGILSFYFLVKELFAGVSQRSLRTTLPLLSAFLLAISPWHLQFSRAAFETNVGLTFNILFVLFFLKGLHKPWMLSLAAFFAGSNLSVYQSERVFTPLLLFALVIIYWKSVFAVAKKYLIVSVVVGLIAALPTVLFILTNPNALQRIQGTSIFAQQNMQSVSNAIIRLKVDKDAGDVIGQVIDNRRVVYTKEIIAGYLSHFNVNWLFIEGDANPRHHASRMGMLYGIELPFLLLGIYMFFFGKFAKQTKYLVFSWLLLAPVPAAITNEVSHAVRVMNMLPPLLLLIAIGYLEAFQFVLKLRKVRIIAFGAFTVFALFTFVYYLNQYFVQQNYFNAASWQYGYKEAIPEIQQIQGNYDKVVVSDSIPLDQSYMFFLFYLRYPPAQYQKIASHKEGNKHNFDKYEFRTFHWDSEKDKKNVLYVGSPNEFPDKINVKKTIFYPDGKAAFLLVDPRGNI